MTAKEVLISEVTGYVGSWPTMYCERLTATLGSPLRRTQSFYIIPADAMLEGS